MVDVDKLSDAELRTKLLEFGFPVMPITGTTRKVMVKKLKMLLDNKNKISNDKGRKSMGQFSSEEDSDVEIKQVKKDKRRVTMAAPVMQPPAARGGKRTPEPELSGSPKKHELRNTITSSTTTRTQRLLKSSQDEFDTGSDSESDIVAHTSKYSSPSSNDVEYKRGSPIKSSLSTSYTSTGRYSPEISRDASYSTSRNVSFNTNTSPGRVTSFISPSTSASEYAGERLNQIRSRLSLGTSVYDRPASYISPQTEKPESEETPFLSNFTRKLSSLSASKKTDYDGSNDIVKEHDTNGSSLYARNYRSNYKGARGRDTIYDYKSNQNSILKNNFVSFSVLAGAALFFLFLAIIYLGMRSDTAVDLSGVVTPLCVRLDPNSKKGINCVVKEDIENVVHLLSVLKPELHKRAVAHRCFDPTIKPQMTELEIITFCKTNFNIQDEYQIKTDLRNLEIMSFENPGWGVNVVLRENNNGAAGVEDVAGSMEDVVYNDKKIASLMETNPDLPWKCTMYQSFSFVLKGSLVILCFFGILYLVNVGYKYYRYYEQKSKDELGLLVEKVIDILQSSASEEGGDSNNYVVINHVRDMILPLADRKNKEKLWQKAVQYINENESRVRTEVQNVQGEPFEVWRWIGAANLSMSGGVQDKSDYLYRQGRRIVDVQYLITEVLKFPHRTFFFCSSKDVAIKHEIKEGFFSVYLLKCARCRKEYPLCSEDPKSDLMDVNLALVAGIVSLGLELFQLNEICSALQIPPIPFKNYNRYLDEIHEIYRDSKSYSVASKKSSFAESVVTSTPKKPSGASKQSILKDVTDSMVIDDFETTKQNFLNELNKDLSRIEKLTHGQRDSSLWCVERKKRLTASNFGRIVKLRDSTDRKNVVKDFLDSNFTGNVYTEYGNQNETNAIMAFERLTGLKVDKCGLFVHKDYPFLAATPDGLLGSNAIIEVKCPYKAREFTPWDAIQSKEITFATLNGKNLVLKRDDRYYYQVQGQLFVTGREICYFVVWTPKGMLYEIIERDAFCWDKMFPKLEEFYFKFMLPAILKKEEITETN